MTGVLYIGGPLDGQRREIQGKPLYWHIMKPLTRPPFVSLAEAVSPTLTIVRGTYRRGWWSDGYGITSAYEWIGWDDENARTAPREELGPDAMRWTPDVADAELDEWQKILHPPRRVTSRA